MTHQAYMHKPDELLQVASDPPLIRLPVYHAATLQNAILCAESEPHKDVILPGKTLLALAYALRNHKEG